MIKMYLLFWNIMLKILLYWHFPVFINRVKDLKENHWEEGLWLTGQVSSRSHSRPSHTITTITSPFHPHSHPAMTHTHETVFARIILPLVQPSTTSKSKMSVHSWSLFCRLKTNSMVPTGTENGYFYFLNLHFYTILSRETLFNKILKPLKINK